MKYLLIFLAAFSIAKMSVADKWRRSDAESKYRFGEMECTQKEVVKSHTVNNKGEVSFTCYSKGKLYLKINEYSERVFSSLEGKYLIGVSNTGIYPSAFWVIDNHGNVVAKLEHYVEQKSKKPLGYCEQTISVKRTWINLNKPDVKFIIKDHQLTDIELTHCTGKKLNLSTLTDFRVIN